MEEEGKKGAEPNSTTTMATYLSEVRLESSPTAIGFSDTCPCCGNKKRRCLQPASSFRKKLLVLDSCNPDPSSASLSLTPSPPPFRYLCSDPISPMSPPLPPLTPAIHPPPPAGAASPAFELPEKTLERSNSTLTAASVEEKNVGSKDGKDAATAEGEEEEVRVSVRCHCDVVRRILLAG